MTDRRWDSTAIEEVVTAILDEERFAGASFTGIRRGGSPAAQKVTLRPVQIAAGRMVQISSCDGERTDVENVDAAELRDRIEHLVDAGFKSIYVKTLDGDLQLTFSKKGRPLLARHRASEQEIRLEHDRPKQRLIDPAAPFLAALGIADRNGRVKPSAQAKFRQVSRFVELLDHTIGDRLQPGQSLEVVDFGCGSGALTLAAYSHLSHNRGLDVSLVGVDSKADLIAGLNDLATDLAWRRVRFQHGLIADYHGAPADLVLALHACDTATDDALAQAIRWSSTYVLAAPCCHHDLQVQIDPASAPAMVGPMLRDGVARERFVDLLTDTIRAETLRDHGYSTDIIEFISTEHTARNLMIRAVRKRGTRARVGAADKIAGAWNVEPALLRRLR